MSLENKMKDNKKPERDLTKLKKQEILKIMVA